MRIRIIGAASGVGARDGGCEYGPAAFHRLQQLSHTDRQGQTLAARGVLEAAFKLAAAQRRHSARMQAEPAGGHREGLGVILGKVREIDPHAGVGEWD